MIYAVTKGKYPVVFAFNVRTQSKVENAMYTMGHGVTNFYLTKKNPRKGFTRVKILDKHGFNISVRD